MARRTKNRTKMEVVPEFACGRYRFRLGMIPFPRYTATGDIETPIGLTEATHSGGMFQSIEDAEDYCQALGAALAYWREHGHNVVGFNSKGGDRGN